VRPKRAPHVASEPRSARAELCSIQTGRVRGITDQEEQEGRHVDLLELVALAHVRTFTPSPLKVEDLPEHHVVRARVIHGDRPERLPTQSRTQ
jgi:hypothetical protein